MAGRNNDGVVARVVVNGIDVRPVAARTDACDIAESIGFIHRNEFFRGKRLTFLRGVNI